MMISARTSMLGMVGLVGVVNFGAMAMALVAGRPWPNQAVLFLLLGQIFGANSNAWPTLRGKPQLHQVFWVASAITIPVVIYFDVQSVTPGIQALTVFAGALNAALWNLMWRFDRQYRRGEAQ